MNKIVFTLGAVTAMCACGLVIDPDKLVEGNGTPLEDGGAADTNADANEGDGTTTTDANGGTDAASDADGGPIFVEVPECVPAAPNGTQGPYAVTFATSPAAAACPTGYLATPASSAKGNLVAGTIACGSTAGCACGASGSPSCGLRVRYYGDNQCTNLAGTDSLGGGCLDLDNDAYLKVTVEVNGVNCSNTGSTTVAPTQKSTPKYVEDWIVCTPDPQVKLAQCKLGQVGLPPAKAAGACVITTGGTCPAPYIDRIDLSTTGGFTDTRTCVCSCSPSSASCNGGAATIFSEGNCLGGSSKNFDIDVCKPRDGDDGMTGTSPTPGAAACGAKVTPDGACLPTADLHLCCLQ